MQLTQILYTYFHWQLIYKTINFLSTKILIISLSLLLISTYKWDKVFKNGPSRPYHFKFSEGCLPKILLGPFLNTLSYINNQSGLCTSYITNYYHQFETTILCIKYLYLLSCNHTLLLLSFSFYFAKFLF